MRVNGVLHERSFVDKGTKGAVRNSDADELPALGTVRSVIEVKLAVARDIVEYIGRPHTASGIGIALGMLLPVDKIS